MLKSPHFSPTVFCMKNINRLPNGKWQFEIIVNGKRQRRNFSSKRDAISYANNFKQSTKFEVSYFANLDASQIKDIKDALLLLPKGETLTGIVRKFLTLNKPISLDGLAKDFVAIKQAKNASDKLSDYEFSRIKTRMKALSESFETFEEINTESILSFLRQRGKNKTISNWKGTINQFFNYCVRKGAMVQNPLSVILRDEFIKAEEPYKVEILSLEESKMFFSILTKKYPQFVRFYALAMFAGIRVAEIPRLKEEYFKYDSRQIVFPAQIGKVKKSWVLEDLPNNLWEWLEMYKNYPIKRPSDWIRTHGFKPLNLPFNFARHCFSTYHISLYFDFARTARITRNSEQMLKQHYLSKLVDKETAKKYFEILP